MKAIIHLSDLHVALTTDFKNKSGADKSFLITDTESAQCQAYVDSFCALVKKDFPDSEFVLIVSGDVTNEGEAEEFKAASIYVQKIVDQLAVKKSNTLIVPGDHDLHRFSCEQAYRSGSSTRAEKKAFEFQEEKFQNYSTFHDQFHENQFEFGKTLVNNVVLEDEKILFVGINSSILMDYTGGYGTVNYNSLKDELNQLCTTKEEFCKVAVFHHNPVSNYENKETGQWIIEDRNPFLNALRDFGFKGMLFGNEHTRGSGEKRSLYYSDSGSFSFKGASRSFKVYSLEIEEEIPFLKNHLYASQDISHNADLKGGVFSLQSLEYLVDTEVQKLWLKNPPKPALIPEAENIIADTEVPEPEVAPAKSETIPNAIGYQERIFGDKLFEIIRKKNLFHSGHFHWSMTSRAHNWIDISKLLQSSGDLLLAKKAIIDVIENQNLSDEIDFIIGLGMEGNMLSTRAAVKYGKPYSFLPYSYRYEDHNAHEKQLNFENDGRFKGILVVTDVIHDGKTLRKLISKKAKSFFELAERIYVVSLFYTGKEPSLDTGILNIVGEESRIQYYYVRHLRVEECPYGANYQEDCIIVKEGLGCVHSFFDEQKATEELRKHGAVE